MKEVRIERGVNNWSVQISVRDEKGVWCMRGRKEREEETKNKKEEEGKKKGRLACVGLCRRVSDGVCRKEETRDDS